MLLINRPKGSNSLIHKRGPFILDERNETLNEEQLMDLHREGVEEAGREMGGGEGGG